MISDLMHSKNYLILEQEPLLKGSQNLPSWALSELQIFNEVRKENMR